MKSNYQKTREFDSFNVIHRMRYKQLCNIGWKPYKLNAAKRFMIKLKNYVGFR